MHIIDRAAYTKSLAPLIAASINAGTPLLLATLGLLMNERLGALNLGTEGMVLVAATVGFMVGYQTQIPLLGFAAGMLAGIVMAALFAWLALVFVTNQVATGFALSIFGTGLSAFMGQCFVGMSLPVQAHGIPGSESIPFVGPAPFVHHWMVYLSPPLCGAIAWFLSKTWVGLTLRAIGESSEPAYAFGHPVRTVHLGVLLFGDAYCGLANIYLPLIYAPMWVENTVAGRGWITLVLTIFATWRPLRILFGALLFGGVTILQFCLQGMGVSVSSQILSTAPFAAATIVPAIISRNPDWTRLNTPISPGKPFHLGVAQTVCSVSFCIPLLFTST